MSDRTKTRHLSTFEFFEVVQVEYICAILRARIYIRPKDKNHWNKVAQGKRVVIEQIAARNSLPSIFTDSDLESTLNRKVFRENNHPQFVYRDEDQKREQEYYDLFHYYSKGTDVRFDNDGETVVAKITNYTPFSKNITIKLLGTDKNMDIDIKRITRVL